MALFHVATAVPSKAEIIAKWIPTQSWGPPLGTDVERVASFHFDDPDGRVGMETHLIEAGGVLFQVPLTYRDTPIDGAEEWLVGQMEHTALGTRWVYDGLGDDLYRTLLAAVSLTGQGQALGMARYDDRWHVAPSAVRLEGGGWGERPAAVDRFAEPTHAAFTATIVNDRFDLDVFRRPIMSDCPAIGLTATWPGQTEPVVLTSVRQRHQRR